MKRIVTLAVLIVLFIIISIYFYDTRIPNLKITYQTHKMVVQKFTFSWSTLGGGYCRDYPIPPELAKDMTAIKVSPESKIGLSFSKKPEYIEVANWGNNSEIAEKYESTEKGIISPKEKGIFVFSIIGHFNRGQILYVFKLKVE